MPKGLKACMVRLNLSARKETLIGRFKIQKRKKTTKCSGFKAYFRQGTVNSTVDKSPFCLNLDRFFIRPPPCWKKKAKFATQKTFTRVVGHTRNKLFGVTPIETKNNFLQVNLEPCLKQSSCQVYERPVMA